MVINVEGIIVSGSVLVLLACFDSLPVSVNRNFYPGATLFQNETFIDLPQLLKQSNLL